MQSNTVSAIHHLKLAHEHFSDFQREQKDNNAAVRACKVYENYKKRIDGIFLDLITQRFIADETVKALKKEWQSDIFAVPAIYEKISLLAPERREVAELFVDALLSGEEITVQKS